MADLAPIWLSSQLTVIPFRHPRHWHTVISESVPTTAVTRSDAASAALKDVLWQMMMTLLALMTTLNESPVVVRTLVSLQQHAGRLIHSDHSLGVVSLQPRGVSLNNDVRTSK